MRIAQVSLNLFSCFEELQSRIRYNSSNEHTLSLEKRKRVKRNREQCDGGDDSGENKKERHFKEDDEQDRDDNGIVINNDDMEISGDVHKQIGSSISNSHITDSAAVTVSSKSLPNFNNLLDTIRSDKFTQRRAT